MSIPDDQENDDKQMIFRLLNHATEMGTPEWMSSVDAMIAIASQ